MYSIFLSRQTFFLGMRLLSTMTVIISSSLMSVSMSFLSLNAAAFCGMFLSSRRISESGLEPMKLWPRLRRYFLFL